jgi:hypothetical protein
VLSVERGTRREAASVEGGQWTGVLSKRAHLSCEENTLFGFGGRYGEGGVEEAEAVGGNEGWLRSVKGRVDGRRRREGEEWEEVDDPDHRSSLVGKARE